MGVVVGDVIGQLLGLDLGPAFEGYGAFDGVFELANVAVPGVFFEQLSRLLSDGKRLARLLAEFGNKMGDQIRNVLGTIAQRR